MVNWRRNAAHLGSMARTGAKFIVVLCLCVGAFVIDVPPAAAQFDDDGLRVEALTTYTVDPQGGFVDVELDLKVRNETANRTIGNAIEQTYFSAVFEYIPVEAIDIQAELGDGTPVAVKPGDLTEAELIDAAESGVNGWMVDLGTNLYFGQTRAITVSYRLPGSRPRSEQIWSRVNPAFTAIVPLPSGDPGLSNVRVEIPAEFDIDFIGEGMEIVRDGPTTMLEATEIADPLDWFTIVLASSEAELVRSELSVEGLDNKFTVAAWPGDEEWKEFVELGLSDAIPQLEKATGIKWPLAGSLEVVETVAPYLAGYDGEFIAAHEPDKARINVGDAIDIGTLFHELGHAWFNQDFSDERWLTEGLAEAFAIRLGRQMDVGSAVEFDPVVRTSPGNVALNAWDHVGFGADPDPENEHYGYSASYSVISTIADEIGDESMAEAVVTMWDRINPYDPDADNPSDNDIDWRDALDAFEIVGGSEQASLLFDRWVVSVPGAEEIEARDESVAAYDELLAADIDWDTPHYLPELLADWSFEEFDVAVDDAAEVLDGAIEVEVDASAIGLKPNEDVEQAYENATGSRSKPEAVFDDAKQILARQSEALDTVVEAVNASAETRGITESVGLVGFDLDQEVDQVKDAFEQGDYEIAVDEAEEVMEQIDGASGVGTRRLVTASLVMLGLMGLAVVGLRLRRLSMA